MNIDENITPATRPATPTTPFILFELLNNDDELIATGSIDQVRHDADSLTADARADGDHTTVYRYERADLTGCTKGRDRKLCPASEHAMHGVPADER